MTTATETRAQVDVGALALSIRSHAADRLGAFLAGSFDHLEDDDNPLNEAQKAKLATWAIQEFDGFEREVAIQIVKELNHSGVGVWGLPDALADLHPETAD